MLHLDLNGVPGTADPKFTTWHELLADLEANRLAQDHVISSVRFDGEEVTLFRTGDVLNTPLHSVSEICVETMTAQELLAGALAQAEGYLLNLQTSMVDVAETFRAGRADQANNKLQQVLEGVKMFIALLRGIEIQLSDAGDASSGVEHTLHQMTPALEDMIHAQSEKDWTLVADILEYELVAHLSHFENVLNRLKPQLASA